MTVNPVDMQVILPQTGQVNRISRGLQFQQQTEQQILGQQVQQELRHQEQQVKKLTHIEHNRVDNDNKEQKRGSDRYTPLGSSEHQDLEESKEAEVAVNSNLGSVLDIKI